MRRAVVYPPIRHRPLFRGGGGGATCPTSTHPETEHHFNSSRRQCHEDTTQATCMELGTEHHHALACIASLFTSL
ncbi:Hypothetical protein FKW44_013945 [Caligus rogercresseyi]|uniref:Uncharacterized protein n=1 Tax=Caligus rogercresseyi TaxID=217165 RepID=A0A7T8GY85_CALRO|nr:Hypothetical protein FKW44_013945 [Caligus rogercresseyi]